MEIKCTDSDVEEVLATFASSLGDNYLSYRNHVYRVINFCRMLCADPTGVERKIAVAAVFHDIAIWQYRTLDYLQKSQLLAREYLVKTGHEDWGDEVEAMIAFHHKITACRKKHGPLVEAFRKADWIDISGGYFRFNVPASSIRSVFRALPGKGFHKNLARLAWRHAWTHPFRPLPMIKP